MTRTVPDVFREVVARRGAHYAIETDDTNLSYDELDRRSNRVAHALLAEKSDQIIAMIAPLTPEPVIVMLGALKAGRRFAPLDPRDPPERTRLAVAHIGARLVEGIHGLDGGRDDDPAIPLSPDHPSLVFFTSGSAGVPTAVIRNHVYVCQMTVAHGITAGDRAGSILPLAFAGAVSNVFGPLLSGGTVCLFDPLTRSIGALAEWLETARITCFQTSPSTLQAMAAELEARGRTAPAVRLMIIGGEPTEGRHLDLVRSVFPHATIANHYGATEASFLAVTRIAPGDFVEPGPMRFRHLYPDQTITIVDDEGRAVAPGEAGEIRVAGPFVGLGYAGTPPNGARAFIEDGPGRRAIQLRDRARLHADGTLELLERTDLRVKVHGQGVDLEAVERAIADLLGVDCAVVSAVSESGGQTRLVAHVAGKRGTWTARDLRIGLSRTMPPFAIPAAFIRIDEIPRNARGKIDRALLREIAANGPPPESKYVAPRTPREQAIADLVANALGVSQLGVGDDIFDLGADSLTVLGLLTSIGDRFGVTVSPGDLLAAPTVEQLTAVVERRAPPRHRVVVPVHAGGSGTPLFCVPGGGDAGLVSMRRFALRLGRPTFSFVSHGSDQRAVPDRTVTRAAARYVAALRDLQPEGPYLVAGMSFGGLVAYEMARQLEASGAKVALLLLIDPVTRERRPAQSAIAPERGLKRLIADRYYSLTAGLIPRGPRKQAWAFLQLHSRMAWQYRPVAYAGRTLLLRTTEWQRFDDLDLTRSLTGETVVRTIPGRHVTMFTEPHFTTLAAIVRDELAAIAPPAREF